MYFSSSLNKIQYIGICFHSMENVEVLTFISSCILLKYRVGRKYLNPWCGISTSWDMPIKICMAILIDKMQLSREFKGYRCNMKKTIEPSFSWFLYRFLVVCIWDFGLLKVKGHSHKMAKVTKKSLQVLKIKISRKNFCLSNLFLMSLVILP